MEPMVSLRRIHAERLADCFLRILTETIPPMLRSRRPCVLLGRFATLGRSIFLHQSIQLAGQATAWHLFPSHQPASFPIRSLDLLAGDA